MAESGYCPLKRCCASMSASDHELKSSRRVHRLRNAFESGRLIKEDSRRLRVNSRRERRSLHLDARGLNDRPPFSDLGPVVGAKRLGRLLCARGYLLAEIGKALP